MTKLNNDWLYDPATNMRIRKSEIACYNTYEGKTHLWIKGTEEPYILSASVADELDEKLNIQEAV
jgi:hypothetical protein